MRTFACAAVVIAALCQLPHPAVACRFWALVGEEYPENLIADHLTAGTVSLRSLSQLNPDGWGIGCFPPGGGEVPLNRPLVRRGGPPADHLTFREFDVAVEELRSIAPGAAIAHLRKCTASHCGVPDPHPFQRDGVLFAHNGRMSDSLMVELLTADDPNYLESHPPEYVDEYIDSELYFLYLLKGVAEHPDLEISEALRSAVAELALLTDTRLNFVLTAGDTLLALRHAPHDLTDPVYYYPAIGAPSPFWVVASQPLGSNTIAWFPIPARTLAVFVPDQMPAFLPVDSDTTAAIADPPRLRDSTRARPNPARAVVRIPVVVPPGGESIELEIMDVHGRLVWRESHSSLAAGQRMLLWDGRDLDDRPLPSGSYFCHLRCGTEVTRLRVSLLR